MKFVLKGYGDSMNVCKKCNADYKLYIQNLQHREEMERLKNKFIRLKREMAWFMYNLTNDKKHLERCEFELQNGGI